MLSSRDSNRVYLFYSAAGVADGFKTIAKSEKVIAVKTENPRRNVNAHTKIAKPTITAKIETPQQPDDKSNAKLKKSIATKTETPQPSQSNGKSAMKKT